MIRNILEEHQLPTIGDGELYGIIKTNYLSSADHAYLIGNQYFFKEDVDISYFFKERLVEIIANNEGIPTVQTEYVKVPSKQETTPTNVQTEDKDNKKKIIALAGAALLLGTALGIAGMKVAENKTEENKIVITLTDRDEKVKLDENSFENGNYINENKDLIWNALKGTQSDIIVESRINWKTYFGRTKSRNGRKSK